MKRSFLLVLVIPIVSPAAAQSAEELFQQAWRAERVASNPEAAIALYRQVVELPGAERELVARAWLQMGKAYEVLGQDGAVAAYSRVVADYGDFAEVAREAEARRAWLAEPAVEPSRARAMAPGSASSISPPPLEDYGYYGVDISPDGSKVAYTGGREEPPFIHDLVTGDVTRFQFPEGECDNPSTMRFRPGSHEVAYGCWWEPSMVGVYDPSTHTRRVVFNGYDYFGVTDEDHVETEIFDWAEDGRLLVASETFEPGVRDSPQRNHFLFVNVDTGEMEYLADYQDEEVYFWENNACLMRGDRFIFGDWTPLEDDGDTIRRTDTETGQSQTVLGEAGQAYYIYGCDKARNLLYYGAKFGEFGNALWGVFVNEDGTLSDHRKLRELPLDSWAHPIAQDGNIYFSLWNDNYFNRTWMGRLSEDGDALVFEDSETGGRIAGWSREGELRLRSRNWGLTVDEVGSGHSWRLRPEFPVREAVMYPDGGRIMAGSMWRDTTLTWILDARSGDVLHTVEGVTGLAVIDKDAILFAGPTEGNRRCWQGLRPTTGVTYDVKCVDDSGDFGSGRPGRARVSPSGGLVWLGYWGQDSTYVSRVFSRDGTVDLVLDSGTWVEFGPDDTGFYRVWSERITYTSLESGITKELGLGLPAGFSIRNSVWRLHPDGSRFEAWLNVPAPETGGLTVIHRVAELYRAQK